MRKVVSTLGLVALFGLAGAAFGQNEPNIEVIPDSDEPGVMVDVESRDSYVEVLVIWVGGHLSE